MFKRTRSAPAPLSQHYQTSKSTLPAIFFFLIVNNSTTQSGKRVSVNPSVLPALPRQQHNKPHVKLEDLKFFTLFRSLDACYKSSLPRYHERVIHVLPWRLLFTILCTGLKMQISPNKQRLL